MLPAPYSRIGQLPEQDYELIRRLSLRWLRAAGPHNVWAEKAKLCTNFLEGEQWTEEERKTLADVKRSALTFNRINSLFRLIIGYQTNNRMDVTYQPTSDSQSTEDMAKLMTNLYKTESDRVDTRYIDTEVFADGLTTGRGFWDARLDFYPNDLGEWALRCDDPFTIYVDPDHNSYDLCEAGFIQESVWTSIDCVNALYGGAAAEAVESLTAPYYQSSLLTYLGGEEDISPSRYYGQYVDDKGYGNFADIYYADFVDRQAKRIRLLESQYKISTITECFIDLKTGAIEPIPVDWLRPENHFRIQACLDHAAAKGDDITIARRPVKRVRWTVTCGDILLHDDWSPYESYTKIGFFPYFRRGKTRGMIEDLIEPQREINKKRSVLADILNRNANSGWMYQDQSLDPEQEQNLKQYGSMPGINIKYKMVGNNGQPPQRIEPGGYPQGLDRLEQKAQEDMNLISGVNESALGQLDVVQSGRAIEARQRQAVLSIQLYHDQFGRSKKLCGRKFLETVQNHYTEERIFRCLGEDSKLVTYEINKKMMTNTNSIQRLNDVTVGRYGVTVDEVPVSASFKQGQFEETMLLLEKLGPVGMMMVQVAPDLLVDMTSLPRKEDWKRALMSATAMVPPGVEGAPTVPTPIGPAAQTPEQVQS